MGVDFLVEGFCDTAFDDTTDLDQCPPLGTGTGGSGDGGGTGQVPEPATFTLLGGAVLALLAYRRRTSSAFVQ